MAHFYRIGARRAAMANCAGVLSHRALNRSLLARQMLLQRVAVDPLEAVQRLVGMQAQEPQAPYLGLFSRLEGFDPQVLSELLAERRLVRAGLMRVTVHLVSAEDYLQLWPLLATRLAAAFTRGPFARGLGGAVVADVVAAGAALLEVRPYTRAELGAALGERWPEAQPEALAMAATMLRPVIQVPPRGLWRASGQARWTPAEQWLGRSVDGTPDPGAVLKRYLAAFGPATVADIAAWSGLTGLRAPVTGLRDELVVRRDVAGRELFDVPGAPLPDGDTPAPVRFLAPFDNAILAHADRTRIIAPEYRSRVFEDRLMRTFLVDGFVAGTWRIDHEALIVTPFGRLSRGDRAAVEEEAQRVSSFLGLRGVADTGSSR